MDWVRDDYRLTDDAGRIEVDTVCAWLQSTYWAANRTRETIETSLRHSLCFGLFRGAEMAGFARVVTDRSTHGYLCDVFVASEHRGRGLGTWMMRCILEHPELRTVRMDLFTRDAQEFYRALGFGKHAFDCLVRYPKDYAGGSVSSTDS